MNISPISLLTPSLANPAQGAKHPHAHFEPLNQSTNQSSDQSSQTSPTNSLLSLLSSSSSSQGVSALKSLLSNQLGALGTSLRSGNLSAARQAYSAFRQDLAAPLPNSAS